MSIRPRHFHSDIVEIPGDKSTLTSFKAKVGLRPLLYNRGGGFQRIENKANQSDLFEGFAFGFEELLEGGISAVYESNRDIVRVQIAGSDSLSYQIDGLGAPPGPSVSVEGVKSYQGGVTIIDYEDFMVGADLRLTLGGHVIVKQVILKPGHPRHLVFRIFTDQIAKQSGDSLVFGENWRMTLPYFVWDNPDEDRPNVRPPLPAWELHRISRAQWFGRDYYELIITIPPGNWVGWSLDPTVIWQPGASGKDAYAREFAPATNYGNGINILVGGENPIPNIKMNRAFIEFDLASAIPPGSTILSMDLQLWTTGAIQWPGDTERLRRCTGAWSESTLTWNLQPGVAGAIMDTKALANPMTFNIALSEAILMYATNNGMRIEEVPENNATSENYFISSDSAAVNNRPELTIFYIPPAYRRLAVYTLDIWAPEAQIKDQLDRLVPPNEVRPDNWLHLEGLSLPGSRTYDSFVEDPTKIRIVESEYQEGKPVPRIKSDRSQFGEVMTARAAGGQM